jgi:N-acetylglucosaminyldiphosphoundecaprenol N-acetyl-beta-D-mannosaminyltransferase
MRYSTFFVQVDDIKLSDALKQARSFLSDGKQHYITTPNPEMVMMAKRDSSFRDVFSDASLSLIDGFGLKYGLRLFGLPIKNRVTGVDFTQKFLASINDIGVFILGGENGASKRAMEKLKAHGVNVVATMEPERNIYKSDSRGIKAEIIDQHKLILEQIRASHARVLLVALGHGKQEKWIRKYLHKCPEVSVAIGVGGTIDYLSGDVRRAPSWLRALGLEWLWRLLRQPWRASRIITATLSFSAEVLRWIISSYTRYRPLAVACVVNKRGEVLAVKRGGQRSVHWQLPQGGIEDGESVIDAAKRELCEEVGMVDVNFLGHATRKYHYNWKRTPAIPGVVQRHYGYKGQEANVTFWRFVGDDATIKVDGRELIKWKWVPIKKLDSVIHPVRKPLVKILEKDLPKYV